MKRALIVILVFTTVTIGAWLIVNETKTPDQAFPILDTLTRITGGADPNDFNYGPCAYRHGDDGVIEDWETFDTEKKRRLEKLFSEVPLTKIDYSKYKRISSDEIMIGPLCDCEIYEEVALRITGSNLNFPGNLVHTREFGSCIERGGIGYNN